MLSVLPVSNTTATPTKGRIFSRYVTIPPAMFATMIETEEMSEIMIHSWRIQVATYTADVHASFLTIAHKHTLFMYALCDINVGYQIVFSVNQHNNAIF